MNTKLRFAIPTVLVIAIAISMALTSSDSAFGQSGTGGTGPEPTILPTQAPSPEPATATPEAATATAEPTVAPTIIPPTATASPEPTVDPTAVPTAVPTPDGWVTLMVELNTETGLAIFPPELYEAWNATWSAYLQPIVDGMHQSVQAAVAAELVPLSGQVTLLATRTADFDARLTDLQEKLDTLDNLIGVSRDVSYNTTQISDTVSARLAELSSEITNLQLAIAGLKQVPTPGPGGATVVEICNQCSIAP